MPTVCQNHPNPGHRNLGQRSLDTGIAQRVDGGGAIWVAMCATHLRQT